MQPSKNPYQKMQQISETQKSFEANIFRSVNYAMQKAREGNDDIGMKRAVSNNYLLWQTLLHDVASDENKMSRDLRRSIAIVAKTVIKEIDENIDNNLDVDFLLNINTSIIEGLSVSPES